MIISFFFIFYYRKKCWKSSSVRPFIMLVVFPFTASRLRILFLMLIWFWGINIRHVIPYQTNKSMVQHWIEYFTKNCFADNAVWAGTSKPCLTLVSIKGFWVFSQLDSVTPPNRIWETMDIFASGKKVWADALFWWRIQYFSSTIRIFLTDFITELYKIQMLISVKS